MTLAAEIATLHPVTVSSKATVTEAAECMLEADVGDVLVMDGQKLLGILTDRDIVVRVLAKGKNPTRTKAKSVCSPHVVTVPALEPVEEVERLFREHAIRRVPVVDKDGGVLGVASLDDVVRREHPESPFAEVLAAQTR